MLFFTGLIVAVSAASAETVVFSDTFEDGSVSDWVKTTDADGPTVIEAGADRHTGAYGLATYIDNPLILQYNRFVRASHDFVAPVAADYTLSLWARSASCSGCTMSYDVLVDGVSLTRTYAPSQFEQRSFTLSGLSAGNHVLTLGMFTTVAYSGRFYAAFDDVAVSTAAPIPEPSVLLNLMLGLGLLAVATRLAPNGASRSRSRMPVT